MRKTHAGEAVPVGPFINRTTTDGRFCRIPVVFQVVQLPAPTAASASTPTSIAAASHVCHPVASQQAGRLVCKQPARPHP